MGFRVETPGILTTIQDGRRLGYEKFGVSPSGAMDFVSFTQANILAGNAWAESALELTIMGASIVFDGECVIAIQEQICPRHLTAMLAICTGHCIYTPEMS